MVNFLEQLVAEWYQYQGYFVRTNVRFRRKIRGGYSGEMDVLAYHPKTKLLIHVETSTDADSWETRVNRLSRKFTVNQEEYNEHIGLEHDELKRVAVIGFGKPTKDFDESGAIRSKNIEVLPVPELMTQVIATVQGDPMKHAVPEGFPLLRAIQFATWYGKK